MDHGETKPNRTEKTKTYQRISSEKKNISFLSLFFCIAGRFEAILLILFRISLFFLYSSSSSGALPRVSLPLYRILELKIERVDEIARRERRNTPSSFFS